MKPLIAIELGVLPSGCLHNYAAQPADDEAASALTTLPTAIAKAFSGSLGEGLFALAAHKKNTDLSPTFRYWREFSCAYMTARCHSTGEDIALATLPFSLLENPNDWLISAPLMKGSEYLSVQTLDYTWQVIDQWLCEKMNNTGQSLSVFLQQHAPHWHQVGRVCFHLAENKQDADYPFAFMATYIPQLSHQGSARHQPLGNALKAYADQKQKQSLIHVLKPIHEASRHSAIMKDLLDAGDIYHPLAWTPGEAYAFIQELPVYEAAGLTVRLPDWWKKRARPQVSVSVGNHTGKYFTAQSLLDFDVQVILEGHTLSDEDWNALMAADDGLVFLKGQWVEVDKERLSEALTHWKTIEQSVAQEGISFIEGMRLLAGSPMDLAATATDTQPSWATITAGEGLQTVLDHLRNPDSQPLVMIGDALHATLRPYQQQGVNWLWQLTQLKLGACLADDMGLGKTIQVITLLLAIQQTSDKPSLLILPASLLGNWKHELEKFAPSLKYRIIHPSQSSPANRGDKTSPSIEGYDLIISTYGMLSRQPWLLTVHWQLVVLDEAQAIKNPGTRQTKTAKQLKAESRIALTGTPVENRLTDLWSLFDFICPGLLSSAKRFKQFVQSLAEREHDQFAPLRNLVQPYILRRLKTDQRIISDLPDKTEVHAYCHLSKKQAALYEKSVRELVAALENQDGIARKGLILAYLLRFKQICNHPSQWLSDGFFDPQNSGKFTRLSELCEEISARQEKVLVFTQFREMVEPLADFLATCFGQPGLTLHGGTSVKQRQKRVDLFQQETGPPFFVLSIKAGGTGLNLTQASHVIHFDRWWNPAVENQATDRAFRIGQKRNVLVHKMVCQGTIEEKIDAIIAEKSAMASNVLDSGAETLLTEMNDAALIDLVSLDIDAIAQ